MFMVKEKDAYFKFAREVKLIILVKLGSKLMWHIQLVLL